MWALLLFVSDIGFAVHKQQDMIPLDDDDGERSSFHAMENVDLLHPSIFLQFPKMFPFFLGGWVSARESEDDDMEQPVFDLKVIFAPYWSCSSGIRNVWRKLQIIYVTFKGSMSLID